MDLTEIGSVLVSPVGMLTSAALILAVVHTFRKNRKFAVIMFLDVVVQLALIGGGYWLFTRPVPKGSAALEAGNLELQVFICATVAIMLLSSCAVGWALVGLFGSSKTPKGETEARTSKA
jgi:hypothetical protein